MEKILCCDLDGTLFWPRTIFRVIPYKNVKFIRKWIDLGNRFVVVSSRGPEFMHRIKKELERDFDFLAYTGSYIVHDGKIVKNASIPGLRMKEVLDQIDERYKPLAYLMNVDGLPLLVKNARIKIGFLAFLYKVYWRLGFKRREEYILDNDIFDEALLHHNVYKVMIFFGLKKNKQEISKEINRRLREEYTDIESSWTKMINELTPLNCNKGSAIESYCRHMSIDKDNVYVVGDSGNDITMFNKFYENSYCMAKAYPSVKKYAKHVIRRVYKLDNLLLKEEK